jgi:hypothetical protein
MAGSVLRREVLQFSGALCLLALAALLVDLLLHRAGAVWVGRWLGIPGTLLIVASFAYSMRKRKWIRRGQPVVLLRWHEGLAWLGSLLVLVHAGIHFNAILAWLATVAMAINVTSGLTGRFLLERSRRRLLQAQAELQARGVSAAASAEAQYWDTLTFDAVRKWRVVHFPITLAFGVLALAHIVAAVLFWGWR